MISFEKIFSISALIALILYLIQILMIAGCCDKYIKLQVIIFKATITAMVIALASYITTLFVK